MTEQQSKPTKTIILSKGAEIVHNKGFNNTGIQEVLNAAGVPKGSFYFYFKNKNDFGLHLIDFYAQVIYSRLDEAQAMTDLHPLARLRSFFREFLLLFEKNQCQGGCPIGNLAQEMGDLNEDFRQRLNTVFSRLQHRIANLLEEARKEGGLSATWRTQEMAGFILNSWQGAMLQMKVVKSTHPLQTFESIVFDSLLNH